MLFHTNIQRSFSIHKPLIDLKTLGIKRYIPRLSVFKPFVDLSRISNPTGIWLLYAPCTWSLQMGTYYQLVRSASIPMDIFLIEPWFLSLFFVGTVLMRTAGCIINDIWDRNLDVHVERTKNRPIASAEISIKQAGFMLGICLTGGLFTLLAFPSPCIIIGLVSIIPVIIYPAMKRITYYPQMVLGIAINWGSLMGMSALGIGFFDSISISLPLYLGGILWTLVYDTIYAHQDKHGDLKVGIKSTALKFGSSSRIILSILSTLCICFFNVAGYFNEMSLLYFFLLNFGLGSFLLWQTITTNYDDPIHCRKMFFRSSYFGFFFFLIIFMDTLYLYMRKLEIKEKSDLIDT